MLRSLYRILDVPAIYAVSQALLAPGAKQLLTRELRKPFRGLPPGRLVLDVGCGPSSWLFRLNLHPVGLDLSLPYVKQYSQNGHIGVVGSAGGLPFVSESFDTVFTIGLLHHLSDKLAGQSLREMLRVCRAGGSLVVIDAVMSRSPWRRPLAHLARRMDRGGYIRTEETFRCPLEENIPHPKELERFTYSWTGLECLACTATKSPTL